MYCLLTPWASHKQDTRQPWEVQIWQSGIVRMWDESGNLREVDFIFGQKKMEMIYLWVQQASRLQGNVKQQTALCETQ